MSFLGSVPQNCIDTISPSTFHVTLWQSGIVAELCNLVVLHDFVGEIFRGEGDTNP